MVKTLIHTQRKGMSFLCDTRFVILKGQITCSSDIQIEVVLVFVKDDMFATVFFCLSIHLNFYHASFTNLLKKYIYSIRYDCSINVFRKIACIRC